MLTEGRDFSTRELLNDDRIPKIAEMLLLFSLYRSFARTPQIYIIKEKFLRASARIEKNRLWALSIHYIRELSNYDGAVFVPN